MKLADKIAIVTGASRGIGKEIGLAFAREGADVVVTCSASVDTAKDVAAEIEAIGQKSLVIQADVADKQKVEAMVRQVVSQFGRVDILVNNAGMSVVGASVELEEEKWRRGIDVMLSGVFFCSQVAGREMIARKYGKIINIASVNGIGAFPERSCYGSAKAGVMGMTKSLGCEWAKYGINVNAIAPGYIETGLVEDLIEKGVLDKKELAGRTPAHRLGTCDDIAKAAVFLASDDASYIVGHTLVVDGGWSSYGYLESWLKLKNLPRAD